MSTTARFFQTPSEPHLKDILDSHKKSIYLNLNCHHIASIQSFNPVLQTATATLNYPKTIFVRNDATGNYDAQNVSYPTMIDCPVICLGGGNGSLTFPIEQGDECLVLFNDRSLDNWFNGGSGSPLNSPRLHSFSDGIILVGLRSKANSLENYDSARVVLQNGTTLVGVGASLIKIANAGTTLNTQLQNLITEIKSLVTATNTLVTATSAITVICSAPSSASSPPVNAAAILAVATSLATVTTQLTATGTALGELIE